MKKLTGEWVRKAESDYRVAQKLARGLRPEHDFVCFCRQQSAEKYLKALLIERGLTAPRTHNLEDLLALLRPHHAALSAMRRGLLYLTRFAVDVRYPGFKARRSQADAARRWAERVRTEARSIPGLPRPRAKRRRPP